jgi:4-hydroxybenzoyl-CoA reductase subunit beta
MTRPADVAGALAARRETADSRYLAGGTDLVPNLRRGIGGPTLLIDLTGIDELRGCEVGPAGARLGTGVTLASLAAMPQMRERYRAVAEAAEAVAGPGHRTQATVGGNLCLDTRCVYYNQSEWWRQSNGFCLKHRGEVCHVAPQGQRCHAAFSGDLAPALIALGAEVELAGASRRRIPLAELYVEDGLAHLALADDELIVAVHLPPAPPPSRYEKVRVRGSIDFPLAGVAVALAAEGGRVTALRIALTGTNARPFLLAGTEDCIGQPVDDAALQRIDRLVQRQVQPMRTTLISAQYRRLAAAALARRAVASLFAEAGP